MESLYTFCEWLLQHKLRFLQCNHVDSCNCSLFSLLCTISQYKNNLFIQNKLYWIISVFFCYYSSHTLNALTHILWYSYISFFETQTLQWNFWDVELPIFLDFPRKKQSHPLQIILSLLALAKCFHINGCKIVNFVVCLVLFNFDGNAFIVYLLI